jgi:hypothetical protein
VRAPIQEVLVHRKRLLALAPVVLALSATGMSTAAASTASAPRAPQIKHVSSVVRLTDHSEADVTGTYRCWGPSDQMHLWVSVKQGGPDPTAMGSSTTVKAWYDTNISMDVKVRCDGEWHTKTVEVGRHPVANYPTDAEGTPPTRKLGYLHEGKAWVQFCLVPPSGEQFLASSSRWVTVDDGDHDS